MANFNDEEFIIRSYTRRELAMLYCPEETEKGAVRTLSYWINTTPGLLKELEKTGYRSGTRKLSSRQVRIIINHLDPP
jgi:hypothetical protein